jgi:hypothetical protein
VSRVCGPADPALQNVVLHRVAQDRPLSVTAMPCRSGTTGVSPGASGPPTRAGWDGQRCGAGAWAHAGRRGAACRRLDRHRVERAQPSPRSWRRRRVRPCRKRSANLGFVRGGPTGAAAPHYRRNGFATWLFQPAAIGRYPAKAPKPRRPVPLLADPWPGVPVRGRNATSRAEACWLPIADGLTPHGLRHTYKTLMVGLGTPSTVMDDQMGHSDGSVQARYAHATVDMVHRLMDGLTVVWENALDARAGLHPGSPVAVLYRLLRDKIVSQNSPHGDPLTEQDRSAIRDTGPDLLFHGRADRI